MSVYETTKTHLYVFCWNLHAGCSCIDEKKEELQQIEQLVNKACCSNNCPAKIPVDIILGCREQ